MQEKTILKISEIDKKISELYDQKAELIKSVLKKSEKKEIVKVFKLHGDIEKPFMRVTIIDNLKVFTQTAVVYRTSSFRRFESKTEYLKNEPKG